jgi:hypothetical protein
MRLAFEPGATITKHKITWFPPTGVSLQASSTIVRNWEERNETFPGWRQARPREKRAARNPAPAQGRQQFTSDMRRHADSLCRTAPPPPPVLVDSWSLLKLLKLLPPFHVLVHGKWHHWLYEMTHAIIDFLRYIWLFILFNF